MFGFLRWGRSTTPRALVFDVETTGLLQHDRIVTLAYVEMVGTEFAPEAEHLVFNPGRKCHQRAAAVHGWSDRTLRGQDEFEAHATSLHSTFESADLLVGHNIAFDLRFLNSEFERCGLPAVTRPTFCTMQLARETWPGEPASLDACIARANVRRQGVLHGAYEDAWLTANIYRVSKGRRDWLMPEKMMQPTNLRPVPDVTDDPEEVAVRLTEELDGVGIGAARALVEMGLNSAAAVRSAPDSLLLSVKGVGRGKIQKIRGGS